MVNYFLHQIKYDTNKNSYDKGIVIKESLEWAKQSYHAYLGAYAYGNNADTNFVSCMITDERGFIVEPFHETWSESAEKT